MLQENNDAGLSDAGWSYLCVILRKAFNNKFISYFNCLNSPKHLTNKN